MHGVTRLMAAPSRARGQRVNAQMIRAGRPRKRMSLETWHASAVLSTCPGPMRAIVASRCARTCGVCLMK